MTPALVACRAALSAMGSIGAERWLRPYIAGAGVCLTFHRVKQDDGRAFAPNRSLEVTPAFLSLAIDEFRSIGYEFVTIDTAAALVSGLDARHRVRRPFAVVTFDDGYRDNLEIAAPILAAKGVPWAMFTVPAFLRGEGRMWWLELEIALTRLDRVEGTTSGGAFAFDTRTVAQKYAAFRKLRRTLHEATTFERTEIASALTKASSIDPHSLISTECASWAELRKAVASHDLTVGSHTMTHSVLSRDNMQDLMVEINSSKRDLEHGLGTLVRHLAYPHGDASSCGPREFDVAKQAGYATAWTTRASHLNAAGNSMYGLPRVSMNGLYADAGFVRSVASGLPFVFSER